jgi:hypothetical protein
VPSACIATTVNNSQNNNEYKNQLGEIYSEITLFRVQKSQSRNTLEIKGGNKN